MVKPDELRDESKPIASVPSVKSVSVSLPEDDVITITSLPDPDVIVSSPAPPSKVARHPLRKECRHQLRH